MRQEKNTGGCEAVELFARAGKINGHTLGGYRTPPLFASAAGEEFIWGNSLIGK